MEKDLESRERRLVAAEARLAAADAPVVRPRLDRRARQVARRRVAHEALDLAVGVPLEQNRGAGKKSAPGPQSPTREPMPGRGKSQGKPKEKPGSWAIRPLAGPPGPMSLVSLGFLVSLVSVSCVCVCSLCSLREA